MAVQVAESNTTKAKRSKKVVDHIEIHPQLGGGHVVKHVYTDYSHEPRSVPFNKDGVSQGGETINAHLVKHAGLPSMEGAEGNGDETTEQA